MRLACSVAFATSLCAALSAQSPLNTVNPFNGTTQASNGGVVWFDLTASASSDVSVTAFDINCNSPTGGDPIVVTTLIGATYVGNTTTAAAWSNLGASYGTSAVINTPTHVVLTRPICVPAGTTVGVGLILDTGAAGYGHTYSVGPLGPFSNADLTFTAGEAANAPFTTTFAPRVANVNVYYNLGPCTQTGPVDIVAVAEATPNTGTLSGADQPFSNGDTLRWSLVDPFGSSTGLFTAVGLNFAGGSTPVGDTPGIPGLTLLWAGSTPAGLAFIMPPHMIGAGDYSFTTPNTSFFSPGQQVRIQGIVLDPAFAPGSLPVIVTNRTITFTNAPNCLLLENFDGLTTAVGNYPIGWSNNVASTAEWRPNANGTVSGGTGPSAAVSLPNYMYCETSSAGATATFIMDTDTYPSAGVTGVSFFLSRVGATIGTLEVRMGDGAGTFPTVLGTYTGAAASEWTLEALPLGAVAGNVQFQFHYVAGGSFTGDLAIDDFCLY